MNREPNQSLLAVSIRSLISLLLAPFELELSYLCLLAFDLPVNIQTYEGGPTFSVKAKKEVILCGGAIGTPQVLMLSGIGPAAELKRHGIKPVKINENVGQNMRDHFCCSGIVCKTSSGGSVGSIRIPT